MYDNIPRLLILVQFARRGKGNRQVLSGLQNKEVIMKKFLALLVIVFLGVWCYRSCIHKKTDATDDVTVLKQVKVTALSANLRTGPGTNYDYATVSADGRILHAIIVSPVLTSRITVRN